MKMKMENDKYVVFKADLWHQWNKARLNGDPPPTALISLDDAVVIRKQDIFAGPGLFAYANAIQTAIDMLVLQEMTVGGILDERFIKRLHDLRDFFFEQATEAVEVEAKKVPD